MVKNCLDRLNDLMVAQFIKRSFLSIPNECGRAVLRVFDLSTDELLGTFVGIAHNIKAGKEEAARLFLESDVGREMEHIMLLRNQKIKIGKDRGDNEIAEILTGLNSKLGDKLTSDQTKYLPLSIQRMLRARCAQIGEQMGKTLVLVEEEEDRMAKKRTMEEVFTEVEEGEISDYGSSIDEYENWTTDSEEADFQEGRYRNEGTRGGKWGPRSKYRIGTPYPY